MGSHLQFGEPSTDMATRGLLLLFVATLVVEKSSGLFFGTPTSQCRSNSQCPTFRRSRCLGNSFIFCFGRSESYIVSGKCLNRSNIFCDVGNFLDGGRRNRNCRYNQCAQCLEDSDCTSFNQVCSNIQNFAKLSCSWKFPFITTYHIPEPYISTNKIVTFNPPPLQ